MLLVQSWQWEYMTWFLHNKLAGLEFVVHGRMDIFQINHVLDMVGKPPGIIDMVKSERPGQQLTKDLNIQSKVSL